MNTLKQSGHVLAIKNPYLIRTDDGKSVDISKSNPDRVLTIRGHKFKVKDIPIGVARLSCGHTVRGIVFTENDVVYCDQHDSGLTTSTVVSVNN